SPAAVGLSGAPLGPPAHPLLPPSRRRAVDGRPARRLSPARRAGRRRAARARRATPVRLVHPWWRGARHRERDPPDPRPALRPAPGLAAREAPRGARPGRRRRPALPAHAGAARVARVGDPRRGAPAPRLDRGGHGGGARPGGAATVLPSGREAVFFACFPDRIRLRAAKI